MFSKWPFPFSFHPQFLSYYLFYSFVSTSTHIQCCSIFSISVNILYFFINFPFYLVTEIHTAFVLYFFPLHLQHCFYLISFPQAPLTDSLSYSIYFVSTHLVLPLLAFIFPLSPCFSVLSIDISLKCLMSVSGVSNRLQHRAAQQRKPLICRVVSDLLSFALGCMVSAVL